MKAAQILLSISGLLCFVSATHSTSPKDANPVEGFHSWKLVNPNPVWISSHLDGLCRRMTQSEAAGLKTDPHMHKFISVYVNSVAKLTMELGKEFPVGSVIVKEKHLAKTGAVDMSTVMIKHKKGYNPKCGDWEFATLDASGKKFTERGRIASCMGCHKGQAKLDYTFRTYVPM